jgi:hypothetical protein
MKSRTNRTLIKKLLAIVRHPRRGAIAALSAVVMVALLGFVALAVERYCRKLWTG